jgi:hypothetical protein
MHRSDSPEYLVVPTYIALAPQLFFRQNIPRNNVLDKCPIVTTGKREKYVPLIQSNSLCSSCKYPDCPRSQLLHTPLSTKSPPLSAIIIPTYRSSTYSQSSNPPHHKSILIPPSPNIFPNHAYAAPVTSTTSTMLTTASNIPSEGVTITSAISRDIRFPVCPPHESS